MLQKVIFNGALIKIYIKSFAFLNIADDFFHFAKLIFFPSTFYYIKKSPAIPFAYSSKKKQKIGNNFRRVYCIIPSI